MTTLIISSIIALLVIAGWYRIGCLIGKWIHRQNDIEQAKYRPMTRHDKMMFHAAELNHFCIDKGWYEDARQLKVLFEKIETESAENQLVDEAKDILKQKQP